MKIEAVNIIAKMLNRKGNRLSTYRISCAVAKYLNDKYADKLRHSVHPSTVQSWHTFAGKPIGDMEFTIRPQGSKKELHYIKHSVKSLTK